MLGVLIIAAIAAAVVLGSYGNDEERNALFNRLLFVAVPISVGCAAIYNFIVAMVL